MKKLLVSLFAILAISFTAGAANYTIDDAVVDGMIETAVAVAPINVMGEVDLALPASMPVGMPAGATVSGSANPVAAILLTFFLGPLGIHRHYMGTRPWMWAIYLVTIGGIFGIIPFVDFIVEIIALVEENSVARYCGNTSFIMWV